MERGLRFAPAPLPRTSKLVGAGAVAVLLAATASGAHDVAAGRSALGAGGIVLTMIFALGWVLFDKPVAYELAGGQLVVHGLVRTRRFHVRSARRLEAPWRDRFAINGGFGWYGWFRCEQMTVRAFVTDPARRVLVDCAEGCIVVSPTSPEAFIRSLGGVPD